MKFSQIGPYTWPPHVNPSPRVSLLSTALSNGGLPKPPTAVRVVVEADPGFPAVGGVTKSTTPLSRARHLPHSLLRLAFVSFSSLSSPWMASEQLAFIDRIRELRSTDFKSTATKARQPS